MRVLRADPDRLVVRVRLDDRVPDLRIGQVFDPVPRHASLPVDRGARIDQRVVMGPAPKQPTQPGTSSGHSALSYPVESSAAPLWIAKNLPIPGS